MKRPPVLPNGLLEMPPVSLLGFPLPPAPPLLNALPTPLQPADPEQDVAFTPPKLA